MICQRHPWKKNQQYTHLPFLTTQLLQKNQISDDYKYNFYLPKGLTLFYFFPNTVRYIHILPLISQF